jgi:hypothetical protein
MRRITLVLALMTIAGVAAAEPQCTKEPKDKWITESEMKAKAISLGYKFKIFKITKGNCYEIYGHDKAGKRVEVYFDPVTGKIVEEHKV